MSVRELILDPTDLDFRNWIADANEIRKYIPQRFEMEQLTAVIYEDHERNVCAAYKDVTHQDFWVRGHMPSLPLLPGVLMLEAAAQLCSYFCQRHDLLGCEIIGFGGLEDVRFRDPVVPGDRLLLLCQLRKLRRGQMVIAKFQGLVRDTLVVEGTLKGVPLPVELLRSRQAQTP